MSRKINRRELPKTDSVAELAKFWDVHDLTDFEDKLEEVTEPVFEKLSAQRSIRDSKKRKAPRRKG